MVKRTLLGCIIAMGLAAVAHADAASQATDMPSSAEITGLDGSNVLVNGGQGFSPAQMGQMLKAGDTVLVGEGSTVTLYFAAEKCSMQFVPGTSYQVSAIAPCALLKPDVSSDGGAAAIVAGAGAGGALLGLALTQSGGGGGNPVSP